MSNRISIVIPTYDRPEKLRRALKSCITQSIPPYEILVLDNGQNPKTIEIVQTAAKECTEYPIKHVASKPFDLRAALKYGIELASGNWTILLDDDDFLVPDRLRKDTEIIDCIAHDIIVLVQDFVRGDYRNELVWEHRMAHKTLSLTQALSLDGFPPPPAATWRSSALKAHHSFGLPDGWMTDFELYASLLPHGQIHKTEQIGYIMDDTRSAGRLTTSADKYMEMLELHRQRFRPTRAKCGLDDVVIDRRLDEQKAFFATKNASIGAFFGPQRSNCFRYPKEAVKGLLAPLRSMASKYFAGLLPEMRGSKTYTFSKYAEVNPGLCRYIKDSKITPR